MLTAQRIALIGCGTMGRAIASGLIATGAVARESLHATDRTHAAADKLAHELGIATSIDNAAAARDADVVILCVKPQSVENVLRGLHGAVAHTPLVISIAAGISTSFVEDRLGPNVPVVRAMPNTPCAIGKGMTVVSPGTHATEQHVAIARAIFESVGRCVELEEKHLDTVTGLTGSGPAFIYVVIEALADGGVMRGLPRHVATELVAQTTLGAAEMVLATGRHPAALKDDVTTPAGCTIAGILALEDGRIRSVLARGVETAARVAGELGKS